MKQRIVLLLLVCSLLIFPILSIKQTSAKSSVAPPIEWRSQGSCFAVQESSDGGYILFGKSELYFTSFFGTFFRKPHRVTPHQLQDHVPPR